MKHNFDYKVPNQIGSFGQLGVLKKNAFVVRAANLKGTTLFVIKKYRYEGVKEGPKPNDIIQLMRTEHGCKISYDLAWEAREYAVNCVRGIPEESYGKIPMYLHMAKEANPGTHTAYKTDPDGSFRYMFIAYGQSIRGFHKVMRQVIVVDGTFLKNKYRGTLLVATALDGNSNFCMLLSRMTTPWLLSQTEIHPLLSNTYCLPTSKPWNLHPPFAEQCHLPSPWKRYDIRTTNPAESLNNALRSPREFPVIPLLDSIREMLTRWFYERRTLSSKHNHPLTKAAEMKITEELKRKLPCRHAIRAIFLIGKQSHEYSDDVFKTEFWRVGYEEAINPMGVPEDAWCVTEDLEDELVTCPESRRAAGRFETVEDKIRSHKKLKRYTSAVDVISPATTEQPVICLYS
ncbi:unnamed protein product [Microthlaspi erraticum]|uniref:MULE transposase domain-containing protein n=1 Tax=Microthlaspi erraticum TaxID=1685480 RepID=A0A6D2IMP3_9BRAS|nr:unnamed protein product [Microthlaspi erraticum]